MVVRVAVATFSPFDEGTPDHATNCLVDDSWAAMCHLG